MRSAQVCVLHDNDGDYPCLEVKKVGDPQFLSFAAAEGFHGFRDLPEDYYFPRRADQQHQADPPTVS